MSQADLFLSLEYHVHETFYCGDRFSKLNVGETRFVDIENVKYKVALNESGPRRCFRGPEIIILKRRDFSLQE